MSTTAKVMAALRQRYSEAGYALLTEVPNATGGRMTRSADAVVMNTWPSRGLSIHGFEVKAYRSDWIKEMRTPEKADAIARYCDYWWLAVAADSVIQKDELPETWGLMVLRGDKLFTVKEAAKLEAQPLSRNFLAAMLRRATEQLIPKDEQAGGLRKEYLRGIRTGEQQSEVAVQKAQKELAYLVEGIAAFEKTSGLKFATWNMGNIGEAVNMVQQIRQAERQAIHTIPLIQQLAARRELIKREASALDQVLELYKKVEETASEDKTKTAVGESSGSVDGSHQAGGQPTPAAR